MIFHHCMAMAFYQTENCIVGIIYYVGLIVFWMIFHYRMAIGFIGFFGSCMFWVWLLMKCCYIYILIDNYCNF